MDTLLRWAERTRCKSRWLGYAATALLIALGYLIHRLFLGGVADFPFFPYYTVMVLAVFLFGAGPAMFGLAGGALAVLGPMAVAGHLHLRPVIELSALVVPGVLTVLLIESLFTARLKQATTAQRLAEAFDGLMVAHQDLDESERLARTRLHELRHRIRNDLHLLGAVIDLKRHACADPAVQAALIDVGLRVAALGAVNRRLDPTVVDGRERVNTRVFFNDLIADMANTAGAVAVGVQCQIVDVWMTAERATSVAQIINEFLTNCYKYAFPQQTGRITVTLAEDGDQIVLIVEDDGVGCDPKARPKGTGYGTRIVRALVGGLSGVHHTESRLGSGTRQVVRFPCEAPPIPALPERRSRAFKKPVTEPNCA